MPDGTAVALMSILALKSYALLTPVKFDAAFALAFLSEKELAQCSEVRKAKSQPQRVGFLLDLIGADETNRTSDLLITNQLLYQLSYISNDAYSNKEPGSAARVLKAKIPASVS